MGTDFPGAVLGGGCFVWQVPPIRSVLGCSAIAVLAVRCAWLSVAPVSVMRYRTRLAVLLYLISSCRAW